MTHPSARIITLTPEFAAELLDRNPRNRRYSRANYSTIKRGIERGEWELNGEAIKMAVDGYMLDGQHRCRAVIETGTPIETFLIEGLPASTQDTMDTGKSRSLGDILTIRGEKNATRLASIITKVYTARRYGIRAAASGGHTTAATIRERLDWFERDPQWIRDLLGPARAVQQKAKYPGAALVAALMVTFDGIDPDDSEFFWSRMEDGLHLDSESHPIYVLRAALKTLADNVRGERNERYLAAITIKAWNAFRAGDEIRQLRYRPGGAKPEPFPEPR